ncbi:MAG TPA: transcriptional regulator, partial [Propionibacteriaceae bacterium]|nr:transcriptional regulator [Propionibacteriaceae bacterium]
FADVLPTSIDAAEIRSTFQQRFADDPWYAELYRGHHANHPLHTFHRWYATARAAAEYADVIWVGADRRSAELMGFRAASTYADALEIASGQVGRAPSITVLHGGGGSLVKIP